MAAADAGASHQPDTDVRRAGRCRCRGYQGRAPSASGAAFSKHILAFAKYRSSCRCYSFPHAVCCKPLYCTTSTTSASIGAPLQLAHSRVPVLNLVVLPPPCSPTDECPWPEATQPVQLLFCTVRTALLSRPRRISRWWALRRKERQQHLMPCSQCACDTVDQQQCSISLLAVLHLEMSVSHVGISAAGLRAAGSAQIPVLLGTSAGDCVL